MFGKINDLIAGKKYWPMMEPLCNNILTKCDLCNIERLPGGGIYKVSCCARNLCSQCYYRYFYVPWRKSNISKSADLAKALAAGLLFVPAIADVYQRVRQICIFDCPYCKKKVIYNYKKNTKTIRDRIDIARLLAELRNMIKGE